MSLQIFPMVPKLLQMVPTDVEEMSFTDVTLGMNLKGKQPSSAQRMDSLMLRHQAALKKVVPDRCVDATFLSVVSNHFLFTLKVTPVVEEYFPTSCDCFQLVILQRKYPMHQ